MFSTRQQLRNFRELGFGGMKHDVFAFARSSDTLHAHEQSFDKGGLLIVQRLGLGNETGFGAVHDFHFLQTVGFKGCSR